MLHRSCRVPGLLLRTARAASLAVLVLCGACFPDGVTDEDFETLRVIVAVQAQNDQPVAGAEVAWWPVGLEEVSQNVAGQTGTDGRVSFDVTVWTEITIRITPPAGYAVAEGQSNPITVTLGEVTTVTFSVVAP
jgi:hypothetical protein